LKILNMKKQVMKVLDSPLGRKIVLSADFIISEEFNRELLLAISLVELEMKSQNIDIDKLKGTNFIISETGHLSVQMDDVGNYVYFSVINYSEIKKYENQNSRIAVIIEELVHNFWNYSDEEKIKLIDIKIMKRWNQNIELEDIFDMSTIQDSEKISYLVLTPENFDK